MNLFKSVLLVLFFFMAMDATAHEVKCEIELKPAGIYTKYCPPGTLMDANGTRVNITRGPYPTAFVYDDVRCVRPEIICEKVDEIVDRENEEY